MKTTEALSKIFFRPREVFAALRERPNWLIAAIVLLWIVVATSALVIDSSDRALEKLQTTVIDEVREEPSLELPELSGEENAIVRKFQLEGSREELDGLEVYVARGPSYPVIREMTSIVFFLVGLAFEVAYFRIVSAAMSLKLKTRNWIAFSIWSHLPPAFLAFLGAVLLSLSIGNQTHPFDQANYINYEVFSVLRWIAAPNTPVGGVSILGVDIYHLDAALIWLIALQTVGFREWSRKSVATSLAVVAIPIAILYLIVVWMSVGHLVWHVTLSQGL